MFSVNRSPACIPSVLDCIKTTKITYTNIKLHPIVWYFIQFKIRRVAMEFDKAIKDLQYFLKADSVTINRTYLDWIDYHYTH